MMQQHTQESNGWVLCVTVSLASVLGSDWDEKHKAALVAMISSGAIITVLQQKRTRKMQAIPMTRAVEKAIEHLQQIPNSPVAEEYDFVVEALAELLRADTPLVRLLAKALERVQAEENAVVKPDWRSI